MLDLRLASRTLALVAASLSLTLHAAPGDLDSEFLGNVGLGLTGPSYPDPSQPGSVNALGLQSDGKILAGGTRTKHNNTGDEFTVLKRLNADGSLDTDFDPGESYAAGPRTSTGFAEINAILMAENDSFYIGGTFDSYGIDSAARTNVAKIGATGGLIPSFVPPTLTNTGVGNRFVQTLARQADGMLLIGGAFAHGGRTNLIRVDGATGALDENFTASAVAGNLTTVDCVSVGVDGMIYVSGASNNRPLAVRLFPDGSLDISWQVNFVNSFGRVNKILALRDGRILISGSYDLQGGLPIDYLNCLTPYGTLDQDFQNHLGQGANGWMGGVLQQMPDGRILVGGIFTQYRAFGDVPWASMVILHPNGDVDAFHPFPYAENHNGYITHFYAAAVQPNGQIVAGGWFNRITDPNYEINNIVRFVEDHSPNPSLARLSSDRYVVREDAGSVEVGVYRAGKVGQFSVNYATANGTAGAGSHYTATSGTLTWADGEAGLKTVSIPIANLPSAAGDKTFTFTISNLPVDQLVPPDTATITIRDDEAPPAIIKHPTNVTTNQGNPFTLSVGFSTLKPAFVQWQKDTGSGFQNIPGATDLNYTVAVSDPATHNGTYRATVTSANGGINSNPAAVTILTPAGTVIPAFASTLPSGRSITAAAQDSSGRFVVSTSGTGFSGLQRISATGAVDTTFTESVFALNSGPVPLEAIHILPDGRILAGGFITHITSPAVGGTQVARPALARFSANGVYDSAYAPSLPTVTGTLYVKSFASGAGNKYYVGFGSGGGMRRYFADGSLDSSFTSPPGLGTDFQGEVAAMRELPSGQILVAHRTGRNGQGFTYNFWRLNADGARDTSFASPAGNNDILALDVLPNGHIAIAGKFGTLNGIAGARVAVLQADGTVSPNFLSPLLNDAGTVSKILHRDGRLLIAGDFTKVGAVNLRGIARLNLDGSLDNSFVVGPGANNGVATIDYTASADIFVAGFFSQFNGQPRNAAALLLGRSEIGAVSFEPARVAAVEHDAPLLLTLRRFGPTDGQVSVDWTAAETDPVSAAINVDFVAASGTVTWEDGDADPKTITVNLLDDNVQEPTETFRVVLSNPSGLITTGANATVTVYDSNTPVTFTDHPDNKSLIAGAALTLEAAATSPSPTFYQWFRNGVPVPGATGLTLNIATTTQADAGVYFLQAMNAAGPFNSNPALVIVAPQSGRILAGQATSGRPNFSSGDPWAIVPLPDGGALVGGMFGKSNPAHNINKDYLIRIKPDGSTDTSFNLTMANTVTALHRQADGKILVGGTFTTGNGAPCNHVLRLNADLTLDTDFNTNIGTTIPGFGSVYDFAVDSTGRIYVAYNNFNPSAVYRFSSTGVLDAGYNVGMNSGVTAIAIQGDDKLLVAGNFSQINGTNVSRLGRLETDGTLDATFASLIGGGASYNDILVLKDGRIFVAGSNFANAATIAEVSSTGAFASNVGSGNQVYDLVQGPEGKILVARTSISGNGSLYRLKGTNPLPVPGSSDGDSTFSVGTGPNADVRTIAVAPDGSIWAAGQFSTFNGVATGGIVKLQGDPAGNPAIVNQPVATGVNGGSMAVLSVGAVGTNLTYQWFKGGIVLSDDGAHISGANTAILTIQSVGEEDDDQYYVEIMGGNPTNSVFSNAVQLDVLGVPEIVSSPPETISHPFGTTLTLSAGVLAASPAVYTWVRDGYITLRNGGRYSGADTPNLVISEANESDNGSYILYVTNFLGDTFTTASQVTVTQVPQNRDSTTTALALNTGSSSNQVRAILPLPDGRVLVGAVGQLTGANSTTSGNNLILVNKDYSVASVAAGLFNGPVKALYRLSNGKILVTGDFSTVGGVNRPGVARLNADFTLDTSFAPTAGTTTGAVAIVADSLGQVYLGGSFFNYAGQSGYHYLVRLKENGELDRSYNIQLNNGVAALAREAGTAEGRVLVAGSFTMAGTKPLRGLVPLYNNGQPDTTINFQPDLPENVSITALAVGRLGEIYVAEGFSPYTIHRLKSWGAADETFTFSETLNGQVTSLVVQMDDKLWVGGTFNSPTNRFFRLNADGSRDTTVNVGTGFEGGASSVNRIAQDYHGRVWVGGGFNTYNGGAANRLAVLQGDANDIEFLVEPTGLTVDAGTSSITLNAFGAGNNGITYEWTKNTDVLADSGHITGATTSALTIHNVTKADADVYRVTIRNNAGGIETSRNAWLTVLAEPDITVEPESKISDIGGNVTFTAEASAASAGLTYQWLFNGVPLVNGAGVSGANTTTLTLSNVDFDDAGDYTLRVTNTFGTDESYEANLTVQKRPGGIVAGSPTFGGDVNAILLLPDGSYVVGGAFNNVTINGTQTSRSRLARIKADGTLDLAFPTANSTVRALARDSAGRIFIGGDFTSIDGTNRTRVARLTSAFVLDSAFDTGTSGPNNSVLTLAPVGDGTVYAGGKFTAFTNSATTANRMVKLKTDGSIDTGFTSSATNDVNAILRLANGTLYVGGISNTWQTAALPGSPTGRLVKLSATGVRDTGFAAPDLFTIVNNIILLSDNTLFVSGNAFGQAYLKRQNLTTGADLGLTIDGHLSQAFGIAQQPDGKLLSGALGTFYRTDLTGANDATFDVGTGFSSSFINDIEVDSAGRIYVGGAFTTFNGQAQNRFVILNGGNLESRDGHLPPQSIDFDPLADRAFNPAANSFTVSATASSGLPVTFGVTSGPATITGSTVTITGIGEVTITATQAGNDEFAAATPVSQTFTVSKGNQTINFNSLADRPAGSAPFNLSATASSGLTVNLEVVSGPATLSGNTLTLTGDVGAVTIRATQDGDDNFNAASPVERTFQATSAPVVQVAQKITFSPPASAFFSEGPLTLTATANSSLPVTLTVLSGPGTLDENVLTFTGAGAIKVRASQAGNASFKPAANVDKTITVKADPTALTLLDLKQEYTGTPRPISTLGGADPVTITYKIGSTFVETPPVNAGTYQVKATSGSVTKTGSLAISKAPLQVIPDNQRKFAGQPNPTLTFSYSGFLASDNAANSVTKAPTISTTATATSAGGSYPIKAASGTSANYTFVYGQGTMTVEAFGGLYEVLLKDGDDLPVAKLELTVPSTSKGFTGKLTTPTETATVSLTGTLTTDVGAETATGAATVKKGANTYGVTFTMPLAGDFTASATLNSNPLGSADDGQKLLVLAKGQTLSHVGAHTVVLTPPEPINGSTGVLPGGSGYATGTIDAKGVLKLSGKLADGTTLTASMSADANAGYRLMILPYGARTGSYLTGWIDLEEHPDLPGRRYVSLASDTFLAWAKAAKTADKNYRAGFGPAATQFVMDPWQAPVAKKGTVPAITLADRLGLNVDGEITVTHTDTGSDTNANLPVTITLDAKNAVKVTAPVTTPVVNSTKWKATFTPGTGVISGSFELVDNGKKRPVPFAGILRQPPASAVDDNVIGAGHYLLPALPNAPSTETTSGEMLFQLPAVAP